MIREMGKLDIVPCREIVRANWGDAIAMNFFDEAAAALYTDFEWPPKYYVYEDNGKVVGFAGMMWSWIMSGVMDFVWVNVHPEIQGAGIGRELTKHRIQVAKDEGAKLINLMTKRRAFFEQFGFKENNQFNGWSHMSLVLGDLEIGW